MAFGCHLVHFLRPYTLQPVLHLICILLAIGQAWDLSDFNPICHHLHAGHTRRNINLAFEVMITAHVGTLLYGFLSLFILYCHLYFSITCLL